MKKFAFLIIPIFLASCGSGTPQSGMCSFQARGDGVNMQNSSGPMSLQECLSYCDSILSNSNIQTAGDAPVWECKLNDSVIGNGSF